MKIGESRTKSVAYTFENIREETKYQIFDVSEEVIKENSLSFDGAKDFIAGFWVDLDEEQTEQFNKIMAAATLDELNNYASGLDFIIEKEGVNK